MRRSCVMVSISRNAVSYQLQRPSDKPLVDAINQVRQQHPCYGYRRTHMELTKGVKGITAVLNKLIMGYQSLFYKRFMGLKLGFGKPGCLISSSL